MQKKAAQAAAQAAENAAKEVGKTAKEVADAAKEASKKAMTDIAAAAGKAANAAKSAGKGAEAATNAAVNAGKKAASDVTNAANTAADALSKAAIAAANATKAAASAVTNAANTAANAVAHIAKNIGNSIGNEFKDAGNAIAGAFGFGGHSESGEIPQPFENKILFADRSRRFLDKNKNLLTQTFNSMIKNVNSFTNFFNGQNNWNQTNLRTITQSNPFVKDATKSIVESMVSFGTAENYKALGCPDSTTCKNVIQKIQQSIENIYDEFINAFERTAASGNFPSYSNYYAKIKTPQSIINTAYQQANCSAMSKSVFALTHLYNPRASETNQIYSTEFLMNIFLKFGYKCLKAGSQFIPCMTEIIENDFYPTPTNTGCKYDTYCGNHSEWSVDHYNSMFFNPSFGDPQSMVNIAYTFAQHGLFIPAIRAVCQLGNTHPGVNGQTEAVTMNVVTGMAQCYVTKSGNEEEIKQCMFNVMWMNSMLHPSNYHYAGTRNNMRYYSP